MCVGGDKSHLRGHLNTDMPGNRVILPHLLSLSIVSWACSRRSDSAGRKEIKNGEEKSGREEEGEKRMRCSFALPFPVAVFLLLIEFSWVFLDVAVKCCWLVIVLWCGIVQWLSNLFKILYEVTQLVIAPVNNTKKPLFSSNRPQWLRPEFQPLTLLYTTFDRRGTPIVYFYEQIVPLSHI